jgi:hypothetical protein
MNILKEASIRVQKEVDKLTIENILKIDMYKYHNDLMEFYIKEIQKELRDTKKTKK